MQRWLLQKVTKQKRLRRAYLKKYPRYLDPDKMIAYNKFSFLQPVPDTRPVSTAVWVNNPRTPAAEVRLFKNIQTDRLQGINEFIKGPMLSNWKGSKVHLYFSGSTYLIVEESDTYRLTSTPFNCRIKAREMWLRDEIVWAEVFKKPDPPSSA